MSANKDSAPKDYKALMQALADPPPTTCVSGGNGKKMLDRLLKYHKWKTREKTFK